MKVVHITNDHGGGLIIVKEISEGLEKYFDSKYITIGNGYKKNNISSKLIFDEEIININSLKNNHDINDAEIILLHYILGYFSLFLFVYLKYFLGKRIICIFHSNMCGPASIFKKSYYNLRKLILLNLMIGADKWVFITNFQKSQFSKFVVGKKRFAEISTVINNGINKSWIRNKNKMFNRVKGAVCRRISKFKGIDVLEEIINHSLDLNIDFTVVGNGKLPKELSGKIKMLSNISHDRLIRVYDRADIFNCYLIL